MSYILPQVRVFQEFRQMPTNVVKNLNPFIFGPNYNLFRYSVTEEKEFIGLGVYDPESSYEYNFPGQPANSEVDNEYVKLFLDNVWAKYCTIPEEATNPLMAVSAGARNKLRAAPEIQGMEGTGTVGTAGGITMGNLDSGRCAGYFTGNAELPEAYYFIPSGGLGDTSGSWAPSGWRTDYADTAAEAGRINYVSTEGSTGSVDIPANVNPLEGGLTIEVPDLGIHLDFNSGNRWAKTVVCLDDTGGGTNTAEANAMSAVTAIYATPAFNLVEAWSVGANVYVVASSKSPISVVRNNDSNNTDIEEQTKENSLYAPREVTLSNAVDFIKIVPKTSRYKDIVDWTIDDNKPLSIVINTSAAESAVYSDTEHILTINTGHTLKQINEKLIASDASEAFTITTSATISTNLTSAAPDSVISSNWEGGKLVNSGTYLVMPDCFRVKVEANEYTFKTGNGFDRSSHFYSRDVKVGDYIAWAMGSLTCEAKIIDIECDLTTPVVGQVQLDAGNVGYKEGDPEHGDDVESVMALIKIIPGSDNQRDFNGNNSGIFSLSETYEGYTGDYNNGLLENTYTVKISRAGAAGTAEATVTDAEGTYSRYNVPVEAVIGQPNMAKIYLGSNLVMVLSKRENTVDEDALFKFGDTYTFDRPVVSAYDAIDTRAVYSKGAYEDTADTTFIVDVLKGGLFNRTTKAVDGIQGMCKFTINYTDKPVADDALYLTGGEIFKVPNVSGVGTANAVYSAIANDINNPDESVYRKGYSAQHIPGDTTSEGSLIIYGASDLFSEGIGLSVGYTGAVATRSVVYPSASVLNGEYVGSIDDEYIVDVTTSGVLASAKFASSSLLGDSATGITFGGFNAPANLGRNGVTIQFDIDDRKVDEIELSGTAPFSVTITKDGTGVTAQGADADALALIINNKSDGELFASYISTAEVVGGILVIRGPSGEVVTAEDNASTQITVIHKQTADLQPVFPRDTYWVVSMLGAQPQVRITDTAGIGQPSTVTVDAVDVPIPLGLSGASIVFTGNNNKAANYAIEGTGGLVKGEKFYVNCSAAKPGPYKTLVLSEDIPSGEVEPGIGTSRVTNKEPSVFSADLYLVKSGVEVDSKRSLALSASPEYNWKVAADNTNVAVYGGINITDSEVVDGTGTKVFMPVLKADMFIEYRALMREYSDSIYTITDVGDIEDTVGIVDPDNPLAYGLYKCMQNSTDRIVYFMGVPTDDFNGYSEVVEQASKSPDVYALAPTTQDKEIHDLIEAHINAMSTEETKQWRIGAFGVGMPLTIARYTKDTNPTAEDWKATVEDDVRYAGSQYTKLVLENDSGAADFLDEVVAGDTVRINYGTDAWGSATYDEIAVASVESNSVLYLEDSLPTPINNPVKIEIHHNYNVNEQADVLAARAANYANRRILACFPAYIGSNGVTVGSEFIGCALAGLACSVVPQQGLTNLELNGFDDLSLCYRVFTRAQMNKMAENGMFIVTQDTPADRVYIRHQLTTAAKEGNLLTSELSITKNYDSVSYYFAAVLAPFIGKYNVTPELIEVVKTQIEDGISYLSSQTSVGLLGPQVIKDDGERVSQIKTLIQHPVLKDHLYCVVDLALPYPLNNIDMHLVI